jgi:hypothetical protein
MFKNLLAANAAFVTLCATGFFQMPVQAQYTNPYTGRTFNNPTSSLIDTMILNNQRMSMLMSSMNSSRALMQRSLRKGGLKLSKAQKAQADRFAKYRGTMFKAGKPVMPARLASQLSPKDAKQRQQLEKVFDVLLKFYEQRSKQQKAPSTDLARTLSYCIALNYAYSTEQEVSAKGLDELRRKMREALSSDPKFRDLSDAKKQELSEGLVILSHFVALGYDEAKESKDKETMNKFKQLAQANLKAILGVPVQQVKLEHTGLVIAK